MSRTRLICLGLFAVIGLSVDWSTQGEYGNWIGTYDLGSTSGVPNELGGFMISYWAFSQFMVMFPLLMLLELLLVRTLMNRKVLDFDDGPEEDDLLFAKSVAPTPSAVRRAFSRKWFYAYYFETLDALCRKSDLTRMRCFWMSCLCGFVFYISAWTWFLSLTRMPVAYNTSTYQSVGVFVFIFSIFLLKEKIRLLKVLSVVVSVVGIVLLAVGSEQSPSDDYPHQWLGYTLCLFSAGCYALYEVLFARIFGSQTIRGMFLFLGFTGIFVFVCLWPGIIIVNVSGIEPFLSPFSHSAVTAYLIGNGFLQIGFVTFFLFGISLTGSPLFITIGSMLTIPLTATYDRLVNDVKNTPMAIGGMSVIGFAFIFIVADIFLDSSASAH